MAISLGNKAAFTGGHVAGQIFRDIPSILLLFYLTSVVGMNPALAGTAVFIPKAILGSICDLSIGIASDRVSSRFPRRNWLLVGAVGAPIVFLGIFATPNAPDWVQVTYVIASMTLYMGIFSLISVPYLAQYSEVSDTAEERADLMSWRHGYIGVGLLVGSSLAPAMIQWLGGDRTAYLWTAGMLSSVCVVSLVLAYIASCRIKIVQAVSTAKKAISFSSITETFSDKGFIKLFGVFVSHQIAAGMTGASMVFFLTYNMAWEDAMAQLGLLIMLAGIAVIFASPMWIWLSRKYGTRASYQGGVIAHVALLIAWAMCDETTPIYYHYIISGLIGLANSGWGIMLLAFFSDVVSERNKGESQLGGTMAAVWTLGDKFGLALGGALLAGSLLSYFGFSAQAPVDSRAMQGIALSFGLIPALIHVSASIFFWKKVVLPGEEKVNA